MVSTFLNLDTDTTLGGSNAADNVVASQKAIKAYVDAHGGGGTTYTAGSGIDITNNVISVDGVSSSEVTLATVATTGAYSDLTGTPSLSGYQTTSNLVTSVSSQSTDSQYPSAKLFYDTVGNIETLLAAI